VVNQVYQITIGADIRRAERMISKLERQVEGLDTQLLSTLENLDGTPIDVNLEGKIDGGRGSGASTAAQVGLLGAGIIALRKTIAQLGDGFKATQAPQADKESIAARREVMNSQCSLS